MPDRSVGDVITDAAFERAWRAEAEAARLRRILRGVLEGSVILDETDDGQRILLDLHTEPATVVRLDV